MQPKPRVLPSVCKWLEGVVEGCC